MKRIILVITLFLAFTSFTFLNAQWAKTYGGGFAGSIQETSDGGYIVAGYTASISSPAYTSAFFVLKLNSDGDIEWQKSYGGDISDIAGSIQQTSDGGYIVAGSTHSFGEDYGSNFWVLKLGTDGVIEWQKSYGGYPSDSARSIQQTSDGGYIVAGWTIISGGAGRQALVLKLNSDGDIEWQKTYGGSSDDYARSIQQTSDGGYIVAGYTTSFSAGVKDFLVLKLNSDGDIEWQKTYGGSSDDDARSIQQTSDGGYIVAGWTESFGAGVWDFLVLKLNSDGFIEWQKTYGGSNSDFAYSIQETSDGGYIVAGSTQSFGAEGGNVLVLKLYSDGDIDPSCGNFIQTSNATYSDTFILPTEINIPLQETNETPQEVNMPAQEINAIVNIICEYTPSISGSVKTAGGEGIEGVTITFSNEEGTETTNSDGDYSHTVSYGWLGTTTPSKAGYNFFPSSRSYTNVIADQTNQDYTATLNTYSLTTNVNPSDGGNVTKNPDKISYTHGDTVELTADANTGYTFSGWTGDVPSGHENDNPLTITMDSNKTITANFTLKTYTISGTVTFGGSGLEGVLIDGLPGDPTSNNFTTLPQ